jgi:hypothetical protein
MMSMASAPVLALQNHDKAFHVVCDASGFAIDCAFMRFDDEGRVSDVGFQSRQLKRAERDYLIGDK